LTDNLFIGGQRGIVRGEFGFTHFFKGWPDRALARR